MTILSRKADYALVILGYLYQHPEGACAREIAEHYQLSRGFIANILKELCQRGFVTSERGVKGGYVLRRPVESIRLGELLMALDETVELAACGAHDSDEACALSGVCPVKSPIRELHHRIQTLLHGITLADLFQAAGSHPTLQMISPPTLNHAESFARPTVKQPLPGDHTNQNIPEPLPAKS